MYLSVSLKKKLNIECFKLKNILDLLFIFYSLKHLQLFCLQNKLFELLTQQTLLSTFPFPYLGGKVNITLYVMI